MADDKDKDPYAQYEVKAADDPYAQYAVSTGANESPDTVKIGGVPVNLRTGLGAPEAAQEQAKPTPTLPGLDAKFPYGSFVTRQGVRPRAAPEVENATTKGMATTAGMMAAPLLAPEGLGLVGGTLARSALTGLGAGLGESTGQAVTGENPTDPENMKAAGKTALLTGGLSVPFEAAGPLMESLPSAARAGKGFENVMSTSKNIPVDTGPVAEIVQEAQAFGKSGSTPPKVIRDFIKRTATGEPLTYEEARRFSINAGRLSAAERMRTDPSMNRLLAMFSKGMRNISESGAEAGGKGQEFREAMDEYHRAKQLEGVGDNLKGMAKKFAKTIPYGAGMGAGGGLGYGLYRALSGGSEK
jgi:hypothetical protein